MIWVMKHPMATPGMLGYLPQFLSERDPRPAREQFDTNYVHGGWCPFKGFTMHDNGLKYPGDPPMPLLAETKLRDEIVRLYQCSWVAIIQPDGSYEIARMD
jgi:hypothetical protein